MDFKEANLSVCIPDKYKKYGWTNNIKALVAFEYMHNKNLALHFMAKDNKTYFYMLKRAINKQYTKVFKQWFELVKWEDSNSEAIKSLFWRAIHKDSYHIAKYLVINHRDKLNFSCEESIQLMYSTKSSRSMKFIYENYLQNNSIIQRIPFSVWCSIHDLSYFYDDRVMKFMLSVNIPFKGPMNLEFETEENKKPLSLKEALAIFGYRHEPRNRIN